jgi:hypothetical protein
MAVPASASAARFAEIGAEERCGDDRAGGEGRKRLTGLATISPAASSAITCASVVSSPWPCQAIPKLPVTAPVERGARFGRTHRYHHPRCPALQPKVLGSLERLAAVRAVLA